VANKLQKHSKRIAITLLRIATTQHSKNKNHTFAMQKPTSCPAKTPFLHAKNHTFANDM
jgi:hypothetical protein